MGNTLTNLQIRCYRPRATALFLFRPQAMALFLFGFQTGKENSCRRNCGYESHDAI